MFFFFGAKLVPNWLQDGSWRQSWSLEGPKTGFPHGWIFSAAARGPAEEREIPADLIFLHPSHTERPFLKARGGGQQHLFSKTIISCGSGVSFYSKHCFLHAFVATSTWGRRGRWHRSGGSNHLRLVGIWTFFPHAHLKLQEKWRGVSVFVWVPPNP